MIWITLLIVVANGAISPSSRSPIALEPPLSYINFDTSLENLTAQIQFNGTSAFIFTRNCKVNVRLLDQTSDEYIWLQRDYSNPLKPTYQVIVSLNLIDKRL